MRYLLGGAAEAAAQIGAELGRKGKPIGPLDMLIAGHAMALNAVVVTNNCFAFNCIKTARAEVSKPRASPSIPQGERRVGS